MKKLISYIKQEWKFLLFIVILFFILTIKLPYQIYGPGGRINLGDRFTGEEYKTAGSFNVTYISSYPGTLPLLGLSYIIPNWDIVKNDDTKYDHETTQAAQKRDKIMNEVAISNATYIAYKYAGKDINIKESKSYVTYIHQDARTDLKIGDIIISADNKIFENSHLLADYISNKEENETVNFKVLRDNKELECYGTLSMINDRKVIGVSFSIVNEYENISLNYRSKSNELGPSGGLMMALYMYNSLVEEDISKGKNIYGTGTIDMDGHVGEIDGVKYKLIGAYKKGARIFIVPEENYEEAIKVKNDNKLDVEILNVSTFEEALNKIKELK